MQDLALGLSRMGRAYSPLATLDGTGATCVEVGMQTAKECAEYILANVEPIPEVGCWIWMRGLNGRGYPFMRVRGRSMRAHRVSYEVFNGPLNPSLMVCHRCDTPSCVNPDHLFLGTNSENILDSVSKCRHRQSRKEACVNGHPFVPETTYLWTRKNGRVARLCLACRKATYENRKRKP